MMKRISQSNLSLTLMVLFVTTNIPCIFANNTISNIKLSTKIWNLCIYVKSTKIWNGLCIYVKSVLYLMIITIGSIYAFMGLIPVFMILLLLKKVVIFFPKELLSELKFIYFCGSFGDKIETRSRKKLQEELLLLFIYFFWFFGGKTTDLILRSIEELFYWFFGDERSIAEQLVLSIKKLLLSVKPLLSELKPLFWSVSIDNKARNIYLPIIPIIVICYPSYSNILLFQIPVGTYIICAAGGLIGMMLPFSWIPEIWLPIVGKID